MPRTCDECIEGVSHSLEVSDADTPNTRAGLPVANATSSPWQAAPSRYADYRSEAGVPARLGTCIIGTGLSGISTAHHLLHSDPDIKVTLLEARQLSSGASGRNGGHLTCDLFSFAEGLLQAGYTPAEVADHAQFELDNFHALTTVILDEGIDCEYTLKLHYDICADQSSLDVHLAAIETMRRCGGPLDGIEIIDDPRTATRLARLPCHAVILHPYSASLNPYKLVTGMLSVLMDRFPDRLQLYTHTPVTQVSNDGPSIRIDGRDRWIPVENIIYATNGYTSSLLPEMTSVIVPVRGQVLSRPCLKAAVENCSLEHGGEYLSQRPSMEIVLGGGRRFAARGEVGVSDDSALSSSVSRHLHGVAKSLVDDDDEDDEEEGHWEWTGIMGFAKLGIPLVRRLRERQFILAGFTGHGMPRIFLAARHLANLVLDGKATSTTTSMTPVPAGYDEIKPMCAADLSDRCALQKHTFSVGEMSLYVRATENEDW